MLDIFDALHGDFNWWSRSISISSLFGLLMIPSAAPQFRRSDMEIKDLSCTSLNLTKPMVDGML